MQLNVKQSKRARIDFPHVEYLPFSPVEQDKYGTSFFLLCPVNSRSEMGNAIKLTMQTRRTSKSATASCLDIMSA